MKKYKLTYLDKRGNELTSEEITAYNIKEARKLASEKLANTMIGIKRIAVTYLGHEYKYKAYIAANRYSKAFDHAYGETGKSAIIQVKRQNSPDWKDCHVWCVELLPGGERKLAESDLF